ncbi:MAG: D-alanine--D-alanine ligase [Candidatus Omnitrophica bacterium]|nr:D-alanine--D-alanine ligase [Candidatus Omnitrophota bacterium]MDD5488282.1 D-alanine--D-alanine ligase [Candidatus Omnitrophota bacterium]
MKTKKIMISAGIDEVPREDTLDALRCRNSVKGALEARGYAVSYLDVTQKEFSRDPYKLVRDIREYAPDRVFNLFEGFSDNTFQEIVFVKMLEEEKIPFTGNGSGALEACLDKGGAKKILAEHGIDVPEGVVVRTFGDLGTFTGDLPVFIKPVSEDASVGIDRMSLAYNDEEMASYVLDKLERFPAGLMVEEFIPGIEFNAGFTGEYPYDVIGVSMLDYGTTKGRGQYLNFSSKWKADSPEYKRLMPEVLLPDDRKWRDKVIEVSREAANALGCRGYFRVDLRERDGKLYVLDVNPNPDINTDSGFARQGYSKGLKYEDIIEGILGAGLVPGK